MDESGFISLLSVQWRSLYHSVWFGSSMEIDFV